MNEFENNRLGKSAHFMLENGAKCEARVGSDGARCGKEADQILDFDVLGCAEQIPVCQEHIHAVMGVIQEELERQGRSTVFGSNGFGRA